LLLITSILSGAGTNLKVGAPVLSESGGGCTDPAQSAGKIFFVVPLHLFGSKITRLVSAFVMVSTV